MFKKNIILIIVCTLMLEPITLFAAQNSFKDGSTYRPSFAPVPTQPAPADNAQQTNSTLPETGLAGETPLTADLTIPGETPSTDTGMSAESMAGIAAGAAALVGGGALIANALDKKDRARAKVKTSDSDVELTEPDSQQSEGKATKSKVTAPTKKVVVMGKAADPSTEPQETEAADGATAEEKRTSKSTATVATTTPAGPATTDAEGGSESSAAEGESSPRAPKVKSSDDPLEAELEKVKAAQKTLKNDPKIMPLKEAANQAKMAHDTLSTEHADLEVERNTTKRSLVEIQGAIQAKSKEIKSKQDAGEDTSAQVAELEILATKKREIKAIATAQDISSNERIKKLKTLKEKQSTADKAFTKAQEPNKKKLSALKRQVKVLTEAQAESATLKETLTSSEKKLNAAQAMHEALDTSESKSLLEQEQAKYDAHAKALDDHRAKTLKKVAKAAEGDPNKSAKSSLLKRLSGLMKRKKEAADSESDEAPDDETVDKKPSLFAKAKKLLSRKKATADDAPETDTSETEQNKPKKLSLLKRAQKLFSRKKSTADAAPADTPESDASTSKKTAKDKPSGEPDTSSAEGDRTAQEKRLNASQVVNAEQAEARQRAVALGEDLVDGESLKETGKGIANPALEALKTKQALLKAKPDSTKQRPAPTLVERPAIGQAGQSLLKGKAFTKTSTVSPDVAARKAKAAAANAGKK